MIHISVDFQKTCGRVKPMHAVNNGPVYKFAADQRITNIDAFREAGIPYARNHNAPFCATYGGAALVGKLLWAEDFLAQLKAPLDFFSWHVYKNDPKKVT